MAAIEMTIKAMSMADLEETIHGLSRRFQDPEDAPVAVAGEEAASTPAAPPARRRGRPPRVAAAAPSAPADAAPAAEDAADAGAGKDLGGAAGGAGGAVEPEAPAEDQGQADAAVHGAEAQADVDAPAASEVAGGGEAPAAEEAAPTIDDLKTLAKRVAAEKSFAAMQKVFTDKGVPKPGECPAERIPEVMDALRAALGQE